MSVLRPISIFVRNFLVKQHPYFSCCASCGEIQTPLGQRLCASLRPSFPIDLVVPPKALSKAEGPPLSALLQQAPWLRRIYLVTDTPRNAAKETQDIRVISPEALQRAHPQAGNLPVEALLHTLPDLAEHFLIYAYPSLKTPPLHPLDFFSPNGIPLLDMSLWPSCMELLHTAVHNHTQAAATLADAPLLAAQEGVERTPPLFGQCREIFASLLLALQERGPNLSAEDGHYFQLLTRWAYATAKGILVPATVSYHD